METNSNSNSSNFVCEICKAHVSRRKSTLYGNGRACKVHPEVQESLLTRQAEEASRVKSMVSQKQNSGRTHSLVPSGPCCWKCLRTGVSIQEASALMLVGMSMQKLKNVGDKPRSFFDMMSDAKEEAGIAGVPVLHRIQLSAEDMMRVVRLLHQDMQLLVSMSGGFVCLCTECADHLHLDVAPKVSIEQLKNMAVVTALMQPDLDAMAQAEIDCEELEYDFSPVRL